MKKLSKQQKNLTDRLGDNIDVTHWYNWRWHLKHAVRDIDTLEKVLDIKLSQSDKHQLQKTLEKFPMSVTPYYLSLIDREDFENDPVYKQAVPSTEELKSLACEMNDPLAEEKDSPAPGITHRYPDRVLFHVSNTCAMYCRHCTRKRKVGDRDYIPDRKTIEAGLKYIRNTPAVRDVLLSGGDPFLLSDDYLEWILENLRAIEHVQMIRIGTRTPVVLPYRITDELVEMLARFHPLYVNSHFNHPRELTAASRAALAKLADKGVPLGNQTVLLAGVNDCPRIIRELCQRLLQNRVRPYYLYQCDLSEGLNHFRTPVGKGIEIMESMIGHTTGMAVPTFVIDAPEGGGKIPMMPSYMISMSTNKVVLRNYEGVITSYEEPNSYEKYFCDRNCNDCRLQLNLKEGEERNAVGIEKLLADYDDTIVLTPKNTERHSRRSKDKAKENPG